MDTRPRLRGFELVKFLNSNAKKHYRIFMRTISLVGIATADQLVRFAQVYGWLKPKHAKKAMGELRILASGGYLKSVRGPVQAFVFPDSSVCALYGCERRAAFANSFDWHNVLDLCCLRDVPDSMPQSRVAIAVDLNERLLRYLEACRSLFDEERWQLFLDSVTYRNFRVEVECFYECPPDSCWIAWPGAPVDEKPRSWLFVPTKEEGLPELASPAFGSGCYAFWEGTWWKWRKGAWENNPAPLPDGRSLQTGTKPAPDAPSAKHASSETPEAESEALARPESQAPEQAQARARAEASSTAKHAGTDADSPAQAHDGSVAPAPDEPLVPESGETVSLAPSRPSRQLGQFLCSNSTRQYRQLLFVLAIFGIATTDQLLRYCTLHGLIKDPVKARRDLGILASRRFIKVVGEGEGKALAYPAQAWHAGELGAGTLGPSEKTGWKRIIPDSVPQSRIDLILAELIENTLSRSIISLENVTKSGTNCITICAGFSCNSIFQIGKTRSIFAAAILEIASNSIHTSSYCGLSIEGLLHICDLTGIISSFCVRESISDCCSDAIASGTDILINTSDSKSCIAEATCNSRLNT